MNGKKIQLNTLRLMAVLLAVLLTVGIFTTAQAADTSGSCGNSVNWSLSGGVLTVSGSGAMHDFTEAELPPWYAYRDGIYSVTVSKGVTHVGDFAFRELHMATAVRLADSVTTIGQYAFYDCNAVQTVRMSNSVSEIGRSAFERCRSLKNIQLPGTLRTIRRMAFYRCESLLTVTVPASVSTMEGKVFTYCSGLRTATILANIGELPYWTFYGCYALSTVSLSSSITSVGTEAFEDCDQLTSASYGGTGNAASSVQQQIQTAVPDLEDFKSGQDLTTQPSKNITTTTTQEQDGATVTVDQNFYSGQNSVVQTQTTHTGTGATVRIEAVLENEKGWADVDTKVTNALTGTSNLQTLQVDIYLKGNILADSDLARFAGRSIKLIIHTQQGAVWHINGTDLSASGLKDRYDLSYTLEALTKLTKPQAAVIGMGQAYKLVFKDAIDFNVQLELAVGQPRNVASFLAMEKKDAYSLKQRVVIDAKGLAHFYLGSVQKGVEYLIGINIPSLNTDASEDDVIIPESLYNEYPPVERIDKVKYLVTDVKSSWGLTFWQVTLILVGVIVVAALVVGIVMRLQSKKKFKNGRIPPSEDEV